jgi:hypothetical protein
MMLMLYTPTVEEQSLACHRDKRTSFKFFASGFNAVLAQTQSDREKYTMRPNKTKNPDESEDGWKNGAGVGADG